MQIAIQACGGIAAIGAIIIGVLLYYHKETPVVWVTFVSVVAVTLAVCLFWQNNIWEKKATSLISGITSGDKRNRPTFIKATNVKGLTIKDNTVVGDADFADLDKVSDVKASGNKHITPPNKKHEQNR